MPESSNDGPIAPRRTLGGPILPPPPPEMAEEAEQAKARETEAREAEARKQALKQAQQASREERLAERDAEKARRNEERAQQKAREQAAKERQKAARSRATEAVPPAPSAQPVQPVASGPRSQQAGVTPSASSGTAAAATTRGGKGGPRRARRAQLRLVQVDAWSVMKTAFLLSIALGIVLVVAVAIIWGVLGAAGVWASINSIVQQAVGSDTGTPFDIQQYVGTSRVLGFTMIVAVIDVILITAIATLGAFLYNLAAALLGGIEVTLAEDS